MIITISSCDSPVNKGDASFNGGTKLYNNWVKLLKKNGIEAYIVTWDGTLAPWLIEPQPAISMERLKNCINQVKPITGWLDSRAYIEIIDSFYFCDCEIAYTIQKDIRPFYGRIKKVGNNNRYSYAWYSAAHQNLQKMLIPEWSDEDYWKPKAEVRIQGRIGYMAENDTNRSHVEAVKKLCPSFEFVNISGTEQTVLNMMQTCDVFMGINLGKNPLWGEGCPRTQQEAMHAGAVLVAYDVLGNREYLIDGYTGIMTKSNSPEDMANSINRIMDSHYEKERIRERSVDFASKVLSSSGKFEILERFLDL